MPPRYIVKFTFAAVVAIAACTYQIRKAMSAAESPSWGFSSDLFVPAEQSVKPESSISILILTPTTPIKVASRINCPVCLLSEKDIYLRNITLQQPLCPRRPYSSTTTSGNRRVTYDEDDYIRHRLRDLLKEMAAVAILCVLILMYSVANLTLTFGVPARVVASWITGLFLSTLLYTAIIPFTLLRLIWSNACSLSLHVITFKMVRRHPEFRRMEEELRQAREELRRSNSQTGLIPSSTTTIRASADVGLLLPVHQVQRSYSFGGYGAMDRDRDGPSESTLAWQEEGR